MGGNIEFISLGLKNGDKKYVENILQNIKEKLILYGLDYITEALGFISDYHVCNPLCAKKMNLKFIRCSNHLINLSFQKSIKKLFNVKKIKKNGHLKIMKKLIKIIVENFVISECNKLIEFHYNNNDFYLKIEDFKKIFINSKSIFDDLLKKIETDKNENCLKKPKNLNGIRFMNSGPIHYFILKNLFLISEFFWLCLSCCSENLKKEIEKFLEFFKEKSNIINIFIIALIYKKLEIIQKLFRKSNFFQMQNNLKLGLEMLEVESILMDDDFKTIEKFLLDNNLKECFLEKLKLSIEEARNEIKKLEEYYINDDLLKFAALADKNGYELGNKFLNEYNSLSSLEEKKKFDPLNIISSSEFEEFLKCKTDLLFKINDKYKFPGLVEIYKNNFFGIPTTNDCVESSFSYIQKDGEYNMSIDSMERIVIQKFNKIKLDENNVVHQNMFCEEYEKSKNYSKSKKEIKKKNIISTLKEIKRKSPEKLKIFEDKKILENLLVFVNKINSEFDLNLKEFEPKKKNLYNFIERWKKIKLKSNISKEILIKAIMSNDDTLFKDITSQKKSKYKK
jgi:hypothetical protein